MKKHINKLIHSDNTEEAIQTLLLIVMDLETKDSLSLLAGRLSRITSQKLNGMINLSDFNIEKNSINKSILEILKQTKSLNDEVEKQLYEPINDGGIKTTIIIKNSRIETGNGDVNIGGTIKK